PHNSHQNSCRTEIMNQPRNPSTSALIEWEDASQKLATALSAYLQACLFLDTFSGTRYPDTNKTVSSIDHSLDNLHSKLFQELSQSRIVLAQVRNKISSRAYLLPNEILAQIFMDVFYVPGPNEGPFPSMRDGLNRIFGRLHSLLGVCTTWRNVGVALKDPWSVIPVGDIESSRLRPKATSLALQRSHDWVSGNRCLHLAAVLSKQSAAPFFGKEVAPQFSSINIETQFEPSTASISHLLARPLDSQPPFVMSELSIHQFQAPQEFALVFIPDNDYLGFHMTTEAYKRFISMFNSLSILRLRSTNIDWSEITFSDKLVTIHL
ncbi:unnamed protein product, partial [Rhizoctonia solani]